MDKLEERITELVWWRNFWRDSVDNCQDFINGFGDIKRLGKEQRIIVKTNMAIIEMAKIRSNECQAEIDAIRDQFDLKPHYLDNSDWYFENVNLDNHKTLYLV